MSDTEAYKNHYIHRTGMGLYWFSVHEDGAGGPMTSFVSPNQTKDAIDLWLECAGNTTEFNNRWEAKLNSEK